MANNVEIARLQSNLQTALNKVLELEQHLALMRARVMTADNEVVQARLSRDCYREKFNVLSAQMKDAQLVPTPALIGAPYA